MQRWRARWRHWWQSRQARTDRLVLTQRNVYIVPTGAGALFAVVLLVLLVASINYQLNLGYLLTFVLASAGLSSMVTTHATLRGLRLTLLPVDPVFAGEAARLSIRLAHDARDSGRRGPARHGIGLWLQHEWTADERTVPLPTWVEVPAGGEAALDLTWTLPQRGRHALPPIVIETRFPFGLFRAWSYWRAAAPALAWPRPEAPVPPLPWSVAGPGPALRPQRQGNDETDGVRPWRRGDAMSQVLWKRSAQAMAGGGELITRERGSTAAAELTLRWADTPSVDAERRLSRLTAWVLEAERAGAAYALALPGLSVDRDHGPHQQRRCLDALAAWGQVEGVP